MFTLVASGVIMFSFYKTAILNPNQTFFATGGDGLKDYYNTYYYIQYDSSWVNSHSMNYPYGEHVFFTGNQPSVSFILKFIQNHIADVSPYTVGILNSLMLLGFLIGAVFLYLLLVHFKLPALYSMLVAVGITFLSPQLSRMGGHFSLTYIFAIPAMLYFVARFHDRHRYWISAIMGLFVLWSLGTHVYMLGFHASIILLYWFAIFIFQKGALQKKENYYHLGLQFIVPFFIFLIFTLLTNQAENRTSYPWGFLFYRAYPESVFLPLGKPYGRFIYNISNFRYIEWEGIAFVGITATIGFLALFTALFAKLFRRKLKGILQPTDNFVLNVFFWSSIIMLLYSFGIPFIIHQFKSLVHYIGPLKQMRGIARFSWIFFYVINVLIFYLLWNLRTRLFHKYVWMFVMSLAVVVLWYEAYVNLKIWHKGVLNSMPALTDVENHLEENKWVELIEASKYQATIPLPYFHVGSEAFWVDGNCGVNTPTYMVSWKTGIPTMGVMLSRTCINQTLSTLELFNEPYRTPGILGKMNREKDFLLITCSDTTAIPENQKAFLRKASPIYLQGAFYLFHLPFEAFSSVVNNPYTQIESRFREQQLHQHESFLSTRETRDFYFNDYVEDTEIDGYISGKGRKMPLDGKIWIVESVIPNAEPGIEYAFSFWMNSINKDLVLRSRVQIELCNANGPIKVLHDLEPFRLMKIFDGNWGLVECNFILDNPDEFIRWRIRNTDLPRTQIAVDKLLIRPLSTDVFREEENLIMKNNRYYLKGQQP